MNSKPIEDKLSPEEIVERVKTKNVEQVREMVSQFMAKKIFGESPENASQEANQAKEILIEEVEQIAKENILLTIVASTVDDITKKQLTEIEAKIDQFNEDSGNFLQKLIDFEQTSEALKRTLDEYPKRSEIELIIKNELLEQKFDLKNILATKESLDKLKEELEKLISQLRSTVDGGDSQGGLVGEFNKLDKKIESKFNQVDNNLISNTNKLDDVEKNLKEQEEKIERQKWWQILPLITVLFGLFGLAWYLKNGIVKDVQVEIQPKFDTINTELTNIKTDQLKEFNQVKLELNEMKAKQQQILDKLK